MRNLFKSRFSFDLANSGFAVGSREMMRGTIRHFYSRQNIRLASQFFVSDMKFTRPQKGICGVGIAAHERRQGAWLSRARDTVIVLKFEEVWGQCFLMFIYVDYVFRKSGVNVLPHEIWLR